MEIGVVKAVRQQLDIRSTPNFGGTRSTASRQKETPMGSSASDLTTVAAGATMVAAVVGLVGAAAGLGALFI
ncbi:hypothetical protein GCM10023094_28000 [Rhodococcus olei]|uniref:Uncharacterized protein n=1 Tax=Rhodococcus olei TaxID=2161675 RepID=A0ABP8P2R6_9NOCA